MNKNILNKLMKLDSKVADQKLIEVADQFLLDIKKAKTNEAILAILESLETFVYKVPSQALDIARHIIKQKPKKPTIDKSILGKIAGPDHSQILVAVIDVLKELRYISFEPVFDLLVELCGHQEKNVRTKALEATEKQVEYNFHVISKIDLGLQERILKSIKNWNKEKQKLHTDVVQMVLKKLLEASFEGTTMKDEITMVFHRGSLRATDQLKDIRKGAITLGFQLLRNTKDVSAKHKILNIFKYAAYGSDYGSIEEYEALKPIIYGNIEQIIDQYRQLIFKRGKLINELPIIYEIEEQLLLLNTNHGKQIPRIANLIRDIRADKGPYSIYRLIGGDVMDFRFDGDFSVLTQERNAQINDLLSTMELSNYRWWNDVLNLTASYREAVEFWKLNTYRNFLARIAVEKPEIAERLLDDAYKTGKDLKYFTGSFLAGFRKSGNLKLWDKYKEKVIAKKDTHLLIGLLESFEHIQRTELDTVRDADIELLTDIVKRSGVFEYLKDVKNNHVLHYSIFRYLLYVYKANPTKLRSLIKNQIKTNIQFSSTYIDQLSFALHVEWVDLNDWSAEQVEGIYDLLEKVHDLDHDALQIMKYLAGKDFSKTMNVFISRIGRSADEKKSGARYQAVPYHIDHDFQSYITNHEDYPNFIKSCVKKMENKWSVYNWEITHLFQRIGGEIFYQAQLDLINTGSVPNIEKAIRLFKHMEPPNMDMILKIVEKTDQKKIWHQLISAMYATGVVSGEYGLAEAHKRIVEELKTKTKGSTNKSLLAFSKMAVDSFEKQIEMEITRADEERARRKIEFEE